MFQTLPTPLMFIPGYANTENVFYCLISFFIWLHLFEITIVLQKIKVLLHILTWLKSQLTLGEERVGSRVSVDENVSGWPKKCKLIKIIRSSLFYLKSLECLRDDVSPISVTDMGTNPFWRKQVLAHFKIPLGSTAKQTCQQYSVILHRLSNE